MAFNKFLIVVAVSMLTLWFLGIITAHRMGGYIHLFGVGAIIIVLIRVFRDDDGWA